MGPRRIDHRHMRRILGDRYQPSLCCRSIVSELVSPFVYFTIAIIIEAITDLFPTIGNDAGIFAAIGRFSIEVNKPGRTIKLTSKPTISVYLAGWYLIGFRYTLNVTATTVINVCGTGQRNIIHCLVTVVVNAVADFFLRQAWYRAADFSESIGTASQGRRISTCSYANRALRTDFVAFIHTSTQLSSRPLHRSNAPGKTRRLVSSQSPSRAEKPSPSRSQAASGTSAPEQS